MLKITPSHMISLLVLALGWSGLVHAAPTAELWPRWQAHQANSTIRVDHRVWDQFLQAYVTPAVDGINRVAYAEVTPADRAALNTYLDRLQATPVSRLARPEQRAYWINLYNATTVATILDHYPVSSILKINISPGLFTRGPWGKKLLTIEGEEVSLDDIEHRILRPIWNDPRTHYAVNCASLGCPNLQAEAFTADNMETLLNRAASDYVNHPRGAHFDDCDLVVSSIYEWFKSDFGGSDEGVIAHLRRHANEELRQQLEGVTKIEDDEYDWSLNDAS